MTTATAITTNTIGRPARRRSDLSSAIVNRSIPVGALDVWQVRAIEKIASFASLPNGWDSYGSEPVSDELIDAAIDFVRQLKIDRLPVPRVLPISGGGLHFEWESGDREVELELRGDGTVDALLCIGGEPMGVPASSIEALLLLVAR